MPRSPKKPKFKAFNSFANCFGPNQDSARQWTDYFRTSQPLILEIGCGKGWFSLELARQRTDRNIIAVDLKADRLYHPAKQALAEKLNNIVFIQSDVGHIKQYLGPGQVETIWLTFPDPYPKDRHAKHRMTGRKYLKLYHQLLSEDGQIHFKTDNQAFFNWSIGEFKFLPKLFEVAMASTDLHSEEGLTEAKILTNYEKRFLADGLKTQYVQANKIDN